MLLTRVLFTQLKHNKIALYSLGEHLMIAKQLAQLQNITEFQSNLSNCDAKVYF